MKEEADLDFETVELSFILQQMERKRRTNIIILDACRNNPFTANLARSMGTRAVSIGRGLAPVETGVGTFVSFATQPGNVALDGKQANSPFTRAILRHLAEPGLDISVMMRRVREDVIAETNGKQVPWSNSSLVGDSVALNPTKRQIAVEPKAAAEPKVAAVPEGTNKPDQTRTSDTANVALELSFWNTIKDTKNPALLNSYLAQFPGGTFAGLARAMIANLDSDQPATVAQIPNKQQLAAVSTEAATGTQETPKPENNYSISHELQAELKRLGCIAARPDGIWGPKSRGALKRYGKYAKLSLSSFEPSGALLEDMKSRKDRICPIQCGARYNLKNGRCVRKTCARNQVLTKRGNCITKTQSARKPSTRKQSTKKRRRKRPVVVEQRVEPAPRKRTRKKNMFDDERELCPRCGSM